MRGVNTVAVRGLQPEGRGAAKAVGSGREGAELLESESGGIEGRSGAWRLDASNEDSGNLITKKDIFLFSVEIEQIEFYGSLINLVFG